MKFLTKLGLPKTNLIMDWTHKMIQGNSHKGLGSPKVQKVALEEKI